MIRLPLPNGCVPSKTLIRTASVMNLIRRADEFGLPAVDLPEIDLGIVMKRVKNVINKIQVHDSPERFCNLGADVRFGSPEFIDDHELNLNGDKISARTWIIATGSRPALPPVEGLDSEIPAPRTVIGVDFGPDRLVIIVVDGRQPFYSEGATLTQLADLMIDYGVYTAMNMDGGGSSTLVIEDQWGNAQVLNSPIDSQIPGRERPVANHLGVYVDQ